MVSRAAAILLVATSCGGAAPRPFVAPVVREPVVVAIVVDQLAAWVAEERLPSLPRTGGFARLRREGIWYQKAQFTHAISDTGPGHAALYTGTVPRESGVWANERIADDGSKRSLFQDPLTQLVTPSGVEGTGSSPRPLRRPTVADRLIGARPDATVVSISFKDRAAIIGGGRRPTLALWFDRGTDSFATSTAYALRMPAWVFQVAGRAALVRMRKQPWEPLDPAWLEAHARVPDDGPDEANLDGYGTKFPHRVVTTLDPARVMRSSPYADQAVIDLALAAIEHTYDPKAPFFLALGLSANDYVGHTFGPESREAWDILLRVDAQLARLFAGLDRRFGRDGWSVVLSADHGVSKMTGLRVVQSNLAAKCEEAAEAVLGKGPWVIGVLDPWLEIAPKGRALPEDQQDVLFKTLVATLEKEAGIAAARDARHPAAECPPESDLTLDAMICRSLPGTSQPAIMIILGEGAFWDPDLVIGKGANHGTTRDTDRTVPILVRAPGRIEGGTVVTGPVSYTRFSATLLDLLGIAGR